MNWSTAHEHVQIAKEGRTTQTMLVKQNRPFEGGQPDLVFRGVIGVAANRPRL